MGAMGATEMRHGLVLGEAGGRRRCNEGIIITIITTAGIQTHDPHLISSLRPVDRELQGLLPLTLSVIYKARSRRFIELCWPVLLHV